jgi:phosphotransacetylase
MPIVPRSVIADVAVTPYPTARWLNRWAANAQKANPNADVTPVVATRLPALLSRS